MPSTNSGGVSAGMDSNGPRAGFAASTHKTGFGAANTSVAAGAVTAAATGSAAAVGGVSTSLTTTTTAAAANASQLAEEYVKLLDAVGTPNYETIQRLFAGDGCPPANTIPSIQVSFELFEAVQNRFAATKQVLERTKADLLSRNQQYTVVHQDLHRLQEEYEVLRKRNTEAEERNTELHQQRAKLEVTAEQLRREVGQGRTALDTLRNKLARREDELQMSQSRVAENLVALSQKDAVVNTLRRELMKKGGLSYGTRRNTVDRRSGAGLADGDGDANGGEEEGRGGGESGEDGEGGAGAGAADGAEASQDAYTADMLENIAADVEGRAQEARMKLSLADLETRLSRLQEEKDSVLAQHTQYRQHVQLSLQSYEAAALLREDAMGQHVCLRTPYFDGEQREMYARVIDLQTGEKLPRSEGAGEQDSDNNNPGTSEKKVEASTPAASSEPATVLPNFNALTFEVKRTLERFSKVHIDSSSRLASDLGHCVAAQRQALQAGADLVGFLSTMEAEVLQRRLTLPEVREEWKKACVPEFAQAVAGALRDSASELGKGLVGLLERENAFVAEIEAAKAQQPQPQQRSASMFGGGAAADAAAAAAASSSNLNESVNAKQKQKKAGAGDAARAAHVDVGVMARPSGPSQEAAVQTDLMPDPIPSGTAGRANVEGGGAVSAPPTGSPVPPASITAAVAASKLQEGAATPAATSDATTAGTTAAGTSTSARPALPINTNHNSKTAGEAGEKTKKQSAPAGTSASTTSKKGTEKKKTNNTSAAKASAVSPAKESPVPEATSTSPTPRTEPPSTSNLLNDDGTAATAEAKRAEREKAKEATAHAGAAAAAATPPLPDTHVVLSGLCPHCAHEVTLTNDPAGLVTSAMSNGAARGSAAEQQLKHGAGPTAVSASASTASTGAPHAQGATSASQISLSGSHRASAASQQSVVTLPSVYHVPAEASDEAAAAALNANTSAASTSGRDAASTSGAKPAPLTNNSGKGEGSIHQSAETHLDKSNSGTFQDKNKSTDGERSNSELGQRLKEEAEKAAAAVAAEIAAFQQRLETTEETLASVQADNEELRAQLVAALAAAAAAVEESQRSAAAAAAAAATNAVAGGSATGQGHGGEGSRTGPSDDPRKPGTEVTTAEGNSGVTAGGQNSALSATTSGDYENERTPPPSAYPSQKASTESPEKAAAVAPSSAASSAGPSTDSKNPKGTTSTPATSPGSDGGAQLGIAGQAIGTGEGQRGELTPPSLVRAASKLHDGGGHGASRPTPTPPHRPRVNSANASSAPSALADESNASTRDPPLPSTGGAGRIPVVSIQADGNLGGHQGLSPQSSGPSPAGTRPTSRLATDAPGEEAEDGEDGAASFTSPTPGLSALPPAQNGVVGHGLNPTTASNAKHTFKPPTVGYPGSAIQHGAGPAPSFTLDLVITNARNPQNHTTRWAAADRTSAASSQLLHRSAMSVGSNSNNASVMTTGTTNSTKRTASFKSVKRGATNTATVGHKTAIPTNTTALTGNTSKERTHGLRVQLPPSHPSPPLPLVKAATPPPPSAPPRAEGTSSVESLPGGTSVHAASAVPSPPRPALPAIQHGGTTGGEGLRSYTGHSSNSSVNSTHRLTQPYNANTPASVTATRDGRGFADGSPLQAPPFPFTAQGLPPRPNGSGSPAGDPNHRYSSELFSVRSDGVVVGGSGDTGGGDMSNKHPDSASGDSSSRGNVNTESGGRSAHVATTDVPPSTESEVPFGADPTQKAEILRALFSPAPPQLLLPAVTAPVDLTPHQEKQLVYQVLRLRNSVTPRRYRGGGGGGSTAFVPAGAAVEGGRQGDSGFMAFELWQQQQQQQRQRQRQLARRAPPLVFTITGTTAGGGAAGSKNNNNNDNNSNNKAAAAVDAGGADGGPAGSLWKAGWGRGGGGGGFNAVPGGCVPRPFILRRVRAPRRLTSRRTTTLSNPATTATATATDIAEGSLSFFTGAAAGGALAGASTELYAHTAAHRSNANAGGVDGGVGTSREEKTFADPPRPSTQPPPPPPQGWRYRYYITTPAEEMRRWSTGRQRGGLQYTAAEEERSTHRLRHTPRSWQQQRRYEHVLWRRRPQHVASPTAGLADPLAVRGLHVTHPSTNTARSAAPHTGRAAVSFPPFTAENLARQPARTKPYPPFLYSPLPFTLSNGVVLMPAGVAAGAPWGAARSRNSEPPPLQPMASQMHMYPRTRPARRPTRTALLLRAKRDPVRRAVKRNVYAVAAPGLQAVPSYYGM